MKHEQLQKRWAAMINQATGSPLERWYSFFDIRVFEGLFKHGLQGHEMSVHSTMIKSLARAFDKKDNEDESKIVNIVRNQQFLNCSIVFFG